MKRNSSVSTQTQWWNKNFYKHLEIHGLSIGTTQGVGRVNYLNLKCQIGILRFIKHIYFVAETKGYSDDLVPQNVYNAATFFSSFLIARLMKSLIVMPVEDTKAGSMEEIVALRQQIVKQETELQKMEKRMRREPQVDVQMERHKKVRQMRKQLTELKQKMEELSL